MPDWTTVERLATQAVAPRARQMAECPYSDLDAEAGVVTSLLKALAASGVAVSVADWDGLENLLKYGGYRQNIRVIVSVTPVKGSQYGHE
jgi:hypothetical protein